MAALDLKDTRSLLIQALNMALDINNETTFSNSFDVDVTEEGFLFIPRIPAVYMLDSTLYQRIFEIASGTLYPFYTLMKQNGAYFVPLMENSVHTARALFFPWMSGIPTRLSIDNLAAFKKINELPKYL